MSLDTRSVLDRLPSPVTDGILLGALPLGAASLVYVAYLLGHPYPAYGAGLFLETAEQVAASGYGLPTRIPGYTAAGVPFAYPPLAFYVLAVLVDGAGLAPMAVARFLPGLFVVAYVLVFYGVATELAGSARRAALAALLLATAPAVLQWHLSAGGVVRALAFLFALSSCYAGVRLFSTHATQWLAAATVTFALVVLTHPTYAVFVGLSQLLLYVAIDRSARGLAAGAVVGAGGLALAAPWWLHVAAVHGAEVFFGAAGTHGGLGTAPRGLVAWLTAPLVEGGVQWPFYALAYAGGLHALWKRRWLLPAWLLAVALVVPGNRFLFVPGSLLSAAFVFDVLVPAIRDRAPAPGVRRTVSMAVVGIVVLTAVTAGTLYGAGVVTGIRGDGAALPAFVDAADENAMAWVEENTPPGATFVVVGDAAEWLPFLANRTILVGPWGTEWQRPGTYYAQYERFASISGCRDAACLARSLDRADVRPDYVYVPKGRYTVFDATHVQDPSMPESLRAAGTFRVVFENEGVAIAAVRDSPQRRDRSSHATSRSASVDAARTPRTRATTSARPIQTGVT